MNFISDDKSRSTEEMRTKVGTVWSGEKIVPVREAKRKDRLVVVDMWSKVAY